MHVSLLKLTTLFYLIGAVLYLYYVVTLHERGARLGRMFLLIGVIVHAIGFIWRYATAGYTPITNLFESLQFFALAIAAVSGQGTPSSSSALPAETPAQKEATRRQRIGSFFSSRPRTFRTTANSSESAVAANGPPLSRCRVPVVPYRRAITRFTAA